MQILRLVVVAVAALAMQGTRALPMGSSNTVQQSQVDLSRVGKATCCVFPSLFLWLIFCLNHV
ncbi:hypothetical protein PI124_g16846 [Phytophthora idaei]|nr:hypothetical protein PI125_g7655 [Phytophthora idaei]KAG3238174.1 hypothetical protein PI124_g16846 [Phytophthora idaei]